MRLLLDTVTFIWATQAPERLSRKAMAALELSDTIRELSAISISEIAILRALGKLDFTERDVRTGLADLQARVLPYTAKHAGKLFDLPLLHSDPFDRPIIAQAMAEKIPVVTADEKFGLYPGLDVIW